jgi:hypothetical protein
MLREKTTTLLAFLTRGDVLHQIRTWANDENNDAYIF